MQAESITRELNIAGLKLIARIIPGKEKPGQSTWLVFLHDGLGCIETWHDIPDDLVESTGLPALVYDRQGHGESSPLTQDNQADYHHGEALEILPGVLDALNISKAIFIGHSDGGTIALMFAGAFPLRTAGVITEAAHVFVDDVTLEGIRNAVEDYETGELKARLEHYHGSNTEMTFRRWSRTWLDPSYRNWSITDKLSAIKVPLLVIQGRDDEYGTPAQMETIRDGSGGPAEGHLIPDCGHVPHHQSREKVLKLITEFIVGVTS